MSEEDRKWLQAIFEQSKGLQRTANTISHQLMAVIVLLVLIAWKLWE